MSVKTRFKQKTILHETGCLLWIGAVSARGYGRFAYQGRNAMAHRVSFELFKGPIPKGLFVL